jgi:hypothetical protein
MVTQRRHRPRRMGAALIGAVAVAAALPAAASAASCPAQAVTQPFAALGDDNSYFMAPGGDFEGKTNSWVLSGKGKIEDKNDAFKEISGKKALTLEEGSSAASPEVCVDIDRPHLRLAVRNEKGKGSLRVDAVSASGEVWTLASIDAANDKKWRMSDFVPLTGPLNVQDDTVQDVQLRLTADAGTWRVDGVAIDPRVR